MASVVNEVLWVEDNIKLGQSTLAHTPMLTYPMGTT